MNKIIIRVDRWNKMSESFTVTHCITPTYINTGHIHYQMCHLVKVPDGDYCLKFILLVAFHLACNFISFLCILAAFLLLNKACHHQPHDAAITRVGGLVGHI